MKDKTERKEGILRKLVVDYGILLILILLCIILAIIVPSFYSFNNLITIVKQVSIVGTIALGMTFIIITGGIDLSPGSSVALVSVVSASVLTVGGGSVPTVILAGVIVGLIVGAINGILIAYVKIPPFIATLGMQQVARGVALIVSDGRTIAIDIHEKSFLNIGGGNLGVIPIPVIIYLVLAFVCYFILKKTRLGKYTYAIGGNEHAAEVCGINIKKYRLIIYTIGGVLCGIAGLVLAGRTTCGNPSAGLNYEFDAITGAVIGGTSLSGGVGTIAGTIVGSLIIGVLNNGLSMMGVSPYWQQIAKGMLIVLAVVLDIYKVQLRKK